MPWFTCAVSIAQTGAFSLDQDKLTVRVPLPKIFNEAFLDKAAASLSHQVMVGHRSLYLAGPKRVGKTATHNTHTLSLHVIFIVDA